MRGCIVYTFRKCGINVNRNLVIPCFKVITSCCNPKTKRGTQNIKRERERESVYILVATHTETFELVKRGDISFVGGDRFNHRPHIHDFLFLSLTVVVAAFHFFFFGFSLSWVWTMGRKNWRVEIMECMWRHWKMLVSNKSLSWTF